MSQALVEHLATLPVIHAFHRDQLYTDPDALIAKLNLSDAKGQFQAACIAEGPYHAMTWDQMVAAFGTSE
jgi:hypothetical protein